MRVTEGLGAVLADLLDHPITSASNRVFTVMRHIDFLCHLTTRATGEAHFGLVYDHADAAAQAVVEPLSRAAAHLGRAAAHYTLALAPSLPCARPTRRARSSSNWTRSMSSPS
ncbi:MULTISPECIES: hypothetical protein [Streptomyces]|uniref:hypothetical protein n=1 Tax=Streptomyces TaxID=1883 RepID=UPI00340D2D77